MKIFQIVNGFCHWQTPFRSLEETKGFPSDCIFVEAPDYVNEQWGFDDTKEGDERFIRPEPPEGWIYDEDTGTFYPEADIPMMLERAQASKQTENKMALASFLANHPITWIDGKQYGVTMEDQSEIQLNISQYQIQVAAGVENPILEWHSIHEACTPWTLEDLSALILAISAHVYPWFQKMNEYKAQIYACTDFKEVEAIQIIYKTEEELATEKAAMEDVQEEEAIVDTEPTDIEEEVTESTEV